jgi:Protein of unknown function (DUF1592)/Protein of unknown function (DUF1588)/Protein of unknown function (DUF1595)/Protein of unknown function (DUF1585)/Protein of unknown function (DUF1587)
MTRWTLSRALSRAPVLLLPAAAALAAATAGDAGCSPASSRSNGDATGAVDAGTGPSAPSGPPVIGVSLFKAACTPGTPAAAWSPLRRLSRVEYDNMVRDLLADTTQPASAFPPESPLAAGVNFEANTYEGVSSLIVQDYMQAAETLAQTATSDTNVLNNTILPCHTQDDACAQQFIGSWANRAFRGQLDATESASLFQLYSDVKAQFDFTTGIQAVITAVLESPRFLYVVELGDGAATGDVVPLSNDEIAARLALFLWRSVPDATLMQAAASDQLGTVAAVQAQATRMLADPKAKDALDDFTTQWMQLQSTSTVGKDTQFSVWNGDSKLGAELVDETLTNFSQEVLGDGGLVDLLTTPSSYINSDLANFYGKGPGNDQVTVGSGTRVTVGDTAVDDKTFVQTTIPHRAGLLTNASVLATQAHTSLPSSVLRGKLVREQVLCDPIPPPPPGIPAPASALGDAGTTRSLLEEHFNKNPCVSCHQYMDPIGLGFGFFDATGAYQPNDANGSTSPPPQGFPAIDATGQIAPMKAGMLSASFDGAADLAAKLAQAEQTDECFALQELRYALSRIESTDDACSVQQIYGTFAASGWNIQKLMVALVGSDAFRYRSVETPGSECQ